MYDELYATPRAYSLGQMVQRPEPVEPEPGMFAGAGGALVDMVPHGFLTSASSWAPILDGFGMMGDPDAVRAAEGDPSKMVGLVELGVDKDLRETAKKFAPNPVSTGTAGQIIHGVGSTLTKAGTYALTTGPVAPVAFGVDIGIGRTQELTDQGVDVKTASKAGAASGVAAAAGFRLPASLGATRLQSVGIGAAVNPAIGIAERGSINAILENADYEKIAAQYKAFDPLSIAIDAITGGAFGALAHGGKAEGRAATPDEHAAALTSNEVQTRDADTLAKPGDVNAISDAADAQVMARAQIDAGEQVSVAHGLRLDSEMVGQVREALSTNLKEQVIADIRADLKENAAGLTKKELSAATKELDAGRIPPELQARLDSAVDAAVRAVRPAPENGTLRALEPEKAESLSASKASDTKDSGKTTETPEMIASRETVKADPERMISREDGTTAKASDLLKEADELTKQAEVEAGGIRAAIACALRFGT